MEINAQSIVTNFLKDLDKYLEDHFKQLKCRDIGKIYSTLYDDLKHYRGTSTGFDGLTEFIIFRFLIHQLGGNFEEIPKTRLTSEFSRGNLLLRQGRPIDKKRLDHSPDITLFKNENLVAVIEIKAHIKDERTYNEAMEIITEIKNVKNDIRALLIIFSPANITSKCWQKMHDQRASYPWFDWVVLEEDEGLLYEIVEKSLNLNEVLRQ